MPFRPGVILDIMPDTHPTTPPSPESEHSFFSLGSTPKTEARFKDVGSKVSLIYDTDFSCFKENLDLLVKGGIAMMYYAKALHTELTQYIKASTERSERSRASKRQVQKGGVVSSINLASMQRYEVSFDILKDQMKWRAKWKIIMVELIDRLIQCGVIVKRQRLDRSGGEE